jgi:hypothetical protein
MTVLGKKMQVVNDNCELISLSLIGSFLDGLNDNLIENRYIYSITKSSFSYPMPFLGGPSIPQPVPNVNEYYFTLSLDEYNQIKSNKDLVHVYHFVENISNGKVFVKCVGNTKDGELVLCRAITNLCDYFQCIRNMASNKNPNWYICEIDGSKLKFDSNQFVENPLDISEISNTANVIKMNVAAFGKYMEDNKNEENK